MEASEHNVSSWSIVLWNDRSIYILKCDRNFILQIFVAFSKFLRYFFLVIPSGSNRTGYLMVDGYSIHNNLLSMFWWLLTIGTERLWPTISLQLLLFIFSTLTWKCNHITWYYSRAQTVYILGYACRAFKSF